jgi:type IV pilus assembly protein PilQ
MNCVNRKIAFVILLIINIWTVTNGQSVKPELSALIDSLANEIPALNQPVDITVNSVPVSEFMRGVAKESGLNVNIDPAMTQLVSNNFSNVKVRDILLFISRNYNIDISFIGNIVNLKNPVIIPPAVSPGIIVNYQPETGNISVEANGVQADLLAREITKKTGKNIIITPGVQGVIIKSFIRDMPFASAIDKIAIGNNLKASYTDDGFYILEPAEQKAEPARTTQSQRGGSSGYKNLNEGGLIVNAYSTDSIDISAVDAGINEIISKLLGQLKTSYHILAPLTETVTIKCSDVSLDDLLSSLFSGTKTTFRKSGGTYLVGPREMLEMKEVRIVPMHYRTVDSLVASIPQYLKNEVEINEMAELNSLIISGSEDRVESLESFLKSIDRVVPVILIEVLIIENKNSKELSTGITMGLGKSAATTSGDINPGIDITLGSGSVNNLIDGLNGFGWVNLGKVTSNFYMTLKALEEDGYVEIQSTPQLATLNGHEASMSIGNTEYYKEESSTLYGSVTTSSQTVTTYKAVEAELKLVIRPIVSGNQDVTLEVEVEQSDFTDRISEYAPPGKVSRKFKSIIRVKDQEMILMGGLEDNEKNDVRSGLPVLSRIPVLNWIFSSKTKTVSKSKLNIFIKPTIIS